MLRELGSAAVWWNKDLLLHSRPGLTLHLWADPTLHLLGHHAEPQGLLSSRQSEGVIHTQQCPWESAPEGSAQGFHRQGSNLSCKGWCDRGGEVWQASEIHPRVLGQSWRKGKMRELVTLTEVTDWKWPIFSHLTAFKKWKKERTAQEGPSWQSFTS